MTALRIGIVGCGRIAEKHIRTMATLPRIRLAAVSDIAEERMAEAERLYRSLGAGGGPGADTGGVKRYKDYRDMVRDQGVDAVVIATLSGLHAEVALEAIEAGKPVMVEKPIAMTLEDADRVIAGARRRGLPVLVCHQLRYRPLLRELKERLAAGEFGRLLYGSVALRIRRDEAYYAAASWRGSWEHDGGMLINQGIHLIDLLAWYLGDAKRISGHLRRLPETNKETEDAAVASIEFEGGPLGILDANTVSRPSNLEQSVHLFGSQGTAAIGGEAFDRLIRWELAGLEAEKAEQLWADRREHAYMYEDFARAIERGGEPLMSAAEGKRALEIIFAVYRSHLERRPITLPAGGFSPAEMRQLGVWDE